MDPGTALGVISLAFQVFAGCIKGCQLLLDAKDLPRKYGYLRHRLHLEQLKLLDWWNASGFTADTISENAHLVDERTQAIVDSLVEIRSLTLEIGRIKERYDLTLRIVDGSQRENTRALTGSITLESAKVLGTTETLRQKALQYADIVLKCPARLRWAVFDAAKFEQLLARLTELNNWLHFNLEFKQRRRHLQLQETTQLQFLDVFNKLDQIADLIQSFRLPPRGDPNISSTDNTFDNLERLARFKALSMAVGSGSPLHGEDITARIRLGLSPPGSLKLSLTQLEIHQGPEEISTQRVTGMYEKTKVWVEWKDCGERNTTLTHGCVEDRIARLAALLLKNPDKPDGLRLPAARGYVHDPYSARFGLVFESPTLGGVSVPQSLYVRLQTAMKPSLNIRLDMARRLTASLEYLHATKWLHKGLRSDNILFLTPSGSDWKLFCLAGFDYSRPSDPGEVTELPSARREHDLYRHPDVQFDVPREGEYGYKEEHDIYSLGVVLMEIGLWQPIHQFLGISLNRFILRPTTRGVQSQLLKSGSLAILDAEVGERYCEVVRLCLDDDLTHSLEIPIGVTMNRLQKAREILQDIKI